MEYDLIVIGAGSGGVRAARMAAQKGKNVALIEYQALGGTCVNVGCVPKKLFVYASHLSESFEDAEGFGWQSSKPSFSWQQLVANKNQEILRLNGIYEKLLSNANVTLIQGKASLLGPNEVAIEGSASEGKSSDNKPSMSSIKGERILIASGSVPFVPEFSGSEFASTSNDMFYLEHLPKKILIVGGGYIAVEFAGIFAGLGVDTHLVYRGDLFLRGFDNDVRVMLHQEMLKKGVKISFNENVTQIVEQNMEGENALNVTFNSGDQGVFDKVLYATGRVPNTQTLGLEKIALKTNKGAIKVNDRFETDVASVYAIGDVIDRVQLTPVAIEEAMVLVDQLYGDDRKTMNYDNIPSAVFSQPNFASVGLTEQQAETLSDKEGFQLDVYVSEFKAMKYALTNNQERTYMKLIVNHDSDRILGAHMLGDSAAEIIQGIGIALKAGATKSDFDATIGIHPSSAEEFVTMRNVRN